MNAKCPVCESCEYVTLVNTFSKLGTAVGGVGAVVGTTVGAGEVRLLVRHSVPL